MVQPCNAYLHAERCQSHKHIMLNSQHHSIIYKNYVVFKRCFYKCCKSQDDACAFWSLLAMLIATLSSHQKHEQASVCHRAISQSHAIALVYWYLHLPRLFFVQKIYKKQPTLLCKSTIHFKHQYSFAHSTPSHPCVNLFISNKQHHKYNILF